jgi:hypothetical protein
MKTAQILNRKKIQNTNCKFIFLFNLNINRDSSPIDY